MLDMVLSKATDRNDCGLGNARAACRNRLLTLVDREEKLHADRIRAPHISKPKMSLLDDDSRLLSLENMELGRFRWFKSPLPLVFQVL